jgi:uncharacterized protein with PIN domain
VAVAFFRFYAELNDHLPPESRMTDIVHELFGRASVKDRIEALGVPHAEVDLILVNGQAVDFSYIVQDGDRISVYPVFESIDIAPLERLRPAPLREPCFVLDAHLGRLAVYLRLLGFDALYRNDYQDAELVGIQEQEKRILLTRDRGLLKHSAVTRGYYVRKTDVRRQLLEVVCRFDLFGSIKPFQRCLCCSSLLEPVNKEAVLDRLPPNTQEHYDEFQTCPSCGRIYWKGSHYRRMRRLVEWVLHGSLRTYSNSNGMP